MEDAVRERNGHCCIRGGRVGGRARFLQYGAHRQPASISFLMACGDSALIRDDRTQVTRRQVRSCVPL